MTIDLRADQKVTAQCTICDPLHGTVVFSVGSCPSKVLTMDITFMFNQFEPYAGDVFYIATGSEDGTTIVNRIGEYLHCG